MALKTIEEFKPKPWRGWRAAYVIWGLGYENHSVKEKGWETDIEG